MTVSSVILIICLASLTENGKREDSPQGNIMEA